jgi:6-phosphogluconolactonase (cycloisomerase 2 family)
MFNISFRGLSGIRVKLWLSGMALLLIFFAGSMRTDAGLLYLLNDNAAGNAIFGFQVNESTGELTALPGFPVSTGGVGGVALVCHRMVADTANSRLFVINNASNTVSAFSVNPDTGALTPMPFSPIDIGTGTWNAMDVHPSGSPLIVSNGATGGGAVSINITSTTATIAPGSPFLLGAATTFSNAFSPDGAFYYVGGNTGMNIAVFSVNTETGVLTPLEGSPFSTGANNPVAHAIDSQNRLFVVNAVVSGDAPIRIFTLSAGVPTGVTGNPFASGLTQRRQALIHPSGNFYVVGGNTGNNVGVFQISGTGADTTVAPVAGSPFATGGTTANVIAVNHDGNFLFVGNRISRNVTRFGFNTMTGVLTNLGVQPSNTLGSTGDINGIGYFPDVAANASVSGRITFSAGPGAPSILVSIESTDDEVNLATVTNSFGFYSFHGLPTGKTYTITAFGKGMSFTPPSIKITLSADVSGADFTAAEN